jgi:hypothetical protein
MEAEGGGVLREEQVDESGGAARGKFRGERVGGRHGAAKRRAGRRAGSGKRGTTGDSDGGDA